MIYVNTSKCYVSDHRINIYCFLDIFFLFQCSRILFADVILSISSLSKILCDHSRSGLNAQTMTLRVNYMQKYLKFNIKS